MGAADAIAAAELRAAEAQVLARVHAPLKRAQRLRRCRPKFKADFLRERHMPALERC